MNENEMMQDDEISLFDLFEKFRDGWLAVVEKELLELSNTPAGSASVKDTQFAPVSLLTSMRAQKQADVFGLQ